MCPIRPSSSGLPPPGPRRQRCLRTPRQGQRLAAGPQRAVGASLGLDGVLGARWGSARFPSLPADVMPQRHRLEPGRDFPPGEAGGGAPKTRAGARTVYVRGTALASVEPNSWHTRNDGPDGLLLPLRPGQDRHMHRCTLGGYIAAGVLKSSPARLQVPHAAALGPDLGRAGRRHRRRTAEPGRTDHADHRRPLSGSHTRARRGPSRRHLGPPAPIRPSATACLRWSLRAATLTVARDYPVDCPGWQVSLPIGRPRRTA